MEWDKNLLPITVTRIFRSFGTKPDETLSTGDSIVLGRSGNTAIFGIFTSGE